MDYVRYNQVNNVDLPFTKPNINSEHYKVAAYLRLSKEDGDKEESERKDLSRLSRNSFEANYYI